MGRKKVLLKGIAASPGKVKGRVRILLSPEDNSRLKKGEILVAKETTPEYTSAIFRAVAIVTDFGGLLSHPAIIARELGIPGVVGTMKATKILKNGMGVIVDGKKGTIFQETS